MQMLPIKVYIFELADLSASQRCKNEIHTLLVSKDDFFHFRFSSLFLHFLKKKTNAKYCAFDIFPTVPNVLRLKNSLKSYRQKKKECILIPNRLQFAYFLPLLPMKFPKTPHLSYLVFPNETIQVPPKVYSPSSWVG